MGYSEMIEGRLGHRHKLSVVDCRYRLSLCRAQRYQAVVDSIIRRVRQSADQCIRPFDEIPFGNDAAHETHGKRLRYGRYTELTQLYAKVISVGQVSKSTCSRHS